MPRKKQETYEEIKAKLDDTVARLSDEKLTLSEMMKLYEEGTKYAAECQKILDSYRKKIETMNDLSDTDDADAYPEEDE